MDYRKELDRIKDFLHQGDYDVVIKNAATTLEVALREVYATLLNVTPPHRQQSLHQIEKSLCKEGENYHNLGLGKLVRLFRDAAVFERLSTRSERDYSAAQRHDLNHIVNVQMRNASTHHGQHPPESQAGMTYYGLRQFLEDCYLLGPSSQEQHESQERYHYNLLRYWSKGYLSEQEQAFLNTLAQELQLNTEQIQRLEQQAQQECQLAIEAWLAEQPIPFELPPERDYVTQRHNLPSVLARQMRVGLQEYLQATFPMTTPAFEHLLERFMEQPGKLFKGPYLSVQLPFLGGLGKKTYFPELKLAFAPYRHQEMAFARLSDGKPLSTLVATGTGSGKTECFLYPLLSYCHRHRGERGIKAILIYPMNALASDQARRIAALIWNNSELKGQVSAGLYVGDQPADVSTVMQPQGVITDRDTIRNAPPDILLTNYKMLDYMLTRPADFGLWRDNQPETLQFLVVDELHTFDGAQGTDLACLIRRLKARLNSPPNHVCCVGTSATLGQDNTDQILSFASKVFGEAFESEALITEQRQPLHEFLGDSLLRPFSMIPPAWEAAIDPERFDNYGTYIQTQYQLWFGQPLPETQGDLDWRVQLGEDLKGHLFFQNFLRALKSQVKTYDEIFEALNGFHPELSKATPRFREHLLNSLIALISSARLANPKQVDRPLPFLNVRSQFWIREMRRLVASVDPEQPELGFAMDLRHGENGNLPLIHCRECLNVAWGASPIPRQNALNPSLETFYKHFFDRNPNTILIYPDPEMLQDNRLLANVGQIHLCSSCLAYGSSEQSISHQIACGGGAIHTLCKSNPFEAGVRSRNCPVCAAENSLVIIGQRAETLTSVLIGQVFASHYSEDKKIIAFSDSVQDASYRAGVFTDRNYQLMLRAALQQYLDQGTQSSASNSQSLRRSLPDVIKGFNQWWLGLKGITDFIVSFLPADLAWLADYDMLLKQGQLPENSNLLQVVQERVAWEIHREYSFRSRIGRTLEKSMTSMLSPDLDGVQRVLNALLLRLPDELPQLFPQGHMIADAPQARSLKGFLLGFIKRAKEAGAVSHPGIENMLHIGVSFGIFSHSNKFRKQRPIWLSGQEAFRGPRPLSLSSTECEQLFSSQRQTWYEWLAEHYLIDEDNILGRTEIKEFFQILMDTFKQLGYADVWQNQQKGITWTFKPEFFCVETDLLEMRCSECHHAITIPRASYTDWDQMPCNKRPCLNGKYQASKHTENYYAHFYRRAVPERIFAREHTGLLSRQEREAVEGEFMAKQDARQSWYTNLLSCTPTLEMGIDIGDLSTVMLCSVPPGQSNYLQRIGRSGRHDGNSSNVTIAAARPHDLYYFMEPRHMFAGAVESPGVFLAAAAVLERQLTAYCFDRWVETGIPATAIDRQFSSVITTLSANQRAKNKFPFNLFEFISDHHSQLIEGFLTLFQEDLSAEELQDVSERLHAFLFGDESAEGSLNYKILSRLLQVVQEYMNFKRDSDLLKRRIADLEANNVQDDETKKKLADMKQEREGLQKMITLIKSKSLFNLLTDEGILPNYTFPEEGVTLHSVIYRRKQNNEDGYESNTYEYQRPAASAIYELAPNSYFYAGGRKVKVDRIELNFKESKEGDDSSSLELWRFCDQCSHMERENAEKIASRCPRCQSSMWPDQGQKRPLIRMRQVFANTSSQQSLNGIHDEEREMRYFEQSLLVDFDATEIRKAYKVKDDAYPFGFEFITRVQFREVNFGESQFEQTAEEFRINSNIMQAQGFLLCKYCGKVQHPKAKTDPSKIEHAHSCRRRSDQLQNLIESAFLYREFQSEALRLYLPDDPQFRGETCVQSFVAAIQLGLKKRFSGNIDHLNHTLYQEPISQSERGKNFLVLYDSVPGGTGYLKQLAYPKEMLDLLEKSLAHLKACACHQEPDLDGCHLCILGYRQMRHRDHISRDAAIELMATLLRHGQNLVETDSISEIASHVVLESELERRFVEALRRLRLEPGCEDIRVSPEIINGKLGYLLRIAEHTYSVEPQVTLGESEGIKIPSRADFVIRPLRDKQARAIAIFTDGFQFHRDRIGKDMAQRMALVASGKYWVWSLSWTDIDVQLRQEAALHFWNPLEYFEASSWQFAMNLFTSKHHLSVDMQHIKRQSSFKQLIALLRHPHAENWQYHALALSTAWIPNLHANQAELYQDAQNWQEMFAMQCPSPFFNYLNASQAPAFFPKPRNENGVDMALRMPKDALLKGTHPELVQWFVLDDQQRELSGYQTRWNGFLNLYNLFQFLPNSWFVTRQGLVNQFYDVLIPVQTETLSEPELSIHWQEAFELSDSSVHPMLHRASVANWPVPEIGFELCNASGKILAQAEVAFPDHQIALLLPTEADSKDIFINENWCVFVLESNILVDSDAFEDLFLSIQSQLERTNS